MSDYLSEIGYNILTCKNINGLNRMTKKVVASMEYATGRQDIIYTTLLPWESLLSWKQMKQRRAWCPLCLQDDLENKSVLYERLLWKIDVVKSCPIHKTDLTISCPHCKKTQANFSNFSFPGFCSCCRNWLGERIENPEKIKSNSFDLWVSSEIGKVLANSSKVKADVRARMIFADSLRSLMEGSSYISYSSMRSKTGFSVSTIRSLTYGERALSLKVVIKICCSFECSPVDLLLGNKFTLKFRNERKKK